MRRALADVRYPGMTRDIVALGLIRSVAVRDGRVHVSLALSTARDEVPDRLRAAIRERLAVAGAVRTEVQIRPPERGVLSLTVDHDRSCMYYTLRATRGGDAFDFEYLERGPEVWRVRVVRRGRR